jgi:hypothetical protein
MVIYVVRAIEDPMGHNPQIRYFTCYDLTPYKDEKNNFIYEVVDVVECDVDEVEDELIHLNHDIRNNVYDDREGKGL